MTDIEQYRGFTIEFRLTGFCVEAIALNERGERMWTLCATGNMKEDARRHIRNQIDYLLDT